MNTLTQYVYVSDSIESMTEEDLGKILASARMFNAQHGITGFLVYCRGKFMQVLEGTDQDLDKVIERIKADTRHRNINELSRSGIDGRDFGEWFMGYKQVTGGNPDVERAYLTLFQNSLVPMKINAASSSLALSFLKDFATA